MFIGILRRICVALIFLAPALAAAALPAVNPPVRYMSLGDSLAAGYKAQPATDGYSYQLYLDRVFGEIPDTLFANAAVPGASSSDVLNYQIPQVHLFEPTVVTMSVGGNDLLTLLAGPPPSPDQVQQVLGQFAGNVGAILAQLCSELPANGEIYVNNLYTVPEIPGADQVVPLFNSVLLSVVAFTRTLPPCADKTIGVPDVYGAFLGQSNLLLIERYIKKGIQTAEVHPTDKGYRAMEDAFRAVIER